tara:strand:+ start:1096 stop:1383 length:288 start_codon:yes stop_codon:yes gene_type:complete
MEKATIDHLNNLKVILNKVLGSNTLSYKYTNALNEAIEYLSETKLELKTIKARVVVEQTLTGGVIIDIYTSTGDHVDTFEFDPIETISTDEIGET